MWQEGLPVTPFRGVDFNGIRKLLAEVSAQPIDGLSVELEAQLGRFIYRASLPSMGKGHRTVLQSLYLWRS